MYKTLSIMQPYFFPYIGYFQMIGKSDIFLSYDDVSYIQRGWINRNRIFKDGKVKYITVPVNKSSLGTLINQIEIKNYASWKDSFLSKIQSAYSNAPYYKDIITLLSQMLGSKDYTLISDLSLASIKIVIDYIGINIEIFESSKLPRPTVNSREDNLDFYMSQFGANELILPPGSKELYVDWQPKNGVKRTLDLPNVIYDQMKDVFTENLSIIDLLMHCDVTSVRNMILNTSR